MVQIIRDVRIPAQIHGLRSQSSQVLDFVILWFLGRVFWFLLLFGFAVLSYGFWLSKGIKLGFICL